MTLRHDRWLPPPREFRSSIQRRHGVHSAKQPGHWAPTAQDTASRKVRVASTPMRAHLRGCSVCRDDYQSLLALLLEP